MDSSSLLINRSVDEENVVHMHNEVLLFSCRKGYELVISEKWADVEIILSEMSQTQRGKTLHILPKK